MINNNWVRTAIAAAILAGSGSVMAEVSGNVAVVSDYLFDGVSQTDNGPALQGGVDWSHESGLYAGAWASTVDFGDGTDSNAETDWFVGYGGGSESVAFDVGAVLYKYLPSGDDIDYDEIYFGLTFAENTTIKYWYARDYVNSDTKASRFKITHNIALSDDWTLGLEYTRTDISEYYDAGIEALELDLGQAIDAGDDGVIQHFRVGVATEINGFGIDLSYHMTDQDEDDLDFLGIDEDMYSTGGNIVLSVSYGFGE